MLIACRRCINGVVGYVIIYLLIYTTVTNLYLSKSPLESGAIEGDSPVYEKVKAVGHIPEYRGAREILRESRWTII